MTKTVSDSRRDRKKIKMQKHIISNAMTLFKKIGFDATTMESIAEKADIGRATLYRYFPVKESILAAFWFQKSQDAQNHFPSYLENYSNTNLRLKAFLERGLSEGMKNHELYSAYFRYRMQNINDSKVNERLHAGFNNLVRMILTTGIENNEVRNDIPIDALAAQFELATSMVMLTWLRNPENFKLDKTINIAVELFLNGANDSNKKSFII